MRNYCMNCENSQLYTRLFDEERLVCDDTQAVLGGGGDRLYPFFTEISRELSYNPDDGPRAYLYNKLRAERSFYYKKHDNDLISEWVLDNTTGRFFYGDGNNCYHIVFDKQADWLITKMMFSDIAITRVRSWKGPQFDEWHGF